MPIGTTSNMEWLSGPGGSSVEYTAGHGIIVDNYDHIISTDQTVVQDKLTAGEGISIQNNVISANPQRQSDWNQSDSSAVDYIRNKPTIPSGDQLVPSATSSDEDKVLTVDSNGDPVWANPQTTPQVQSNWTESDSSSVSYIQNKPQNLVQDASYVHTDNNFTTAEKTKLDGIESGAEVNVQSDWSQTDNSADDYIKNKPQNLVQDASYVHTDNNYTDADKAKLTGIEAGAEVNVQSDWSQSDSSADDYIKNKPTIPSGNQLVPSATSSDEDKVLTVDSNGDPVWAPSQGGTQLQANWTETDVTDVTYIRNKPVIPSGNQLVPSATSSDEDKVLTVDSNGDPVWAPAQGGTQVQSDWTEDDSSEVSYIQHKPTTKPIQAGAGISVVEYADNIRISGTVDPQVQSDWSENDNTEPDYIKNKPGVKQIVAGQNVTITEGAGQITISSTGAGGVPVQADWTQQDNAQPDYIKNKPSIPDAQVQSNWTESNSSSKAFILNKPTTKPIVAGTGIVITETASEIIISLA